MAKRWFVSAMMVVCILILQVGTAVGSPLETDPKPPTLPIKRYLPLVSRAYVPPAAPVLNFVDNSDWDGNYTITWAAAATATSYVLEEATDSGFSAPVTLYSGAGLSQQVLNQPVGSYYYRVKALNPGGASPWSSTQSVLAPSAGVWFLGNHSTYAIGGTRYVVGEVLNNTGDTINSVKVNVNFYNGANVVATNYNFTLLGNVHAYERACYSVSVPNPAAYTSYTVHEGSTYAIGGSRRPNLGVSGLAGAVVTTTYEVTGSITNNEGGQVSGIKAVATLFSNTWKVAECKSASATVPTLNAGQSSGFKVITTPANPAAIVTYVVQTDGN